MACPMTPTSILDRSGGDRLALHWRSRCINLACACTVYEQSRRLDHLWVWGINIQPNAVPNLFDLRATPAPALNKNRCAAARSMGAVDRRGKKFRRTARHRRGYRLAAIMRNIGAAICAVQTPRWTRGPSVQLGPVSRIIAFLPEAAVTATFTIPTDTLPQPRHVACIRRERDPTCVRAQMHPGPAADPLGGAF